MGGIDLTFSGTGHPLLHPLPFCRPASRRLLLYLYGELLSLPLSCLRGRFFHILEFQPVCRDIRAVIRRRSRRRRALPPDALNEGRRRTQRNWKRRSFVSSLVRRHCSLDCPIFFTDLRSTKESCRGGRNTGGKKSFGTHRA